MRRFVQRALNKLGKLDQSQLGSLITDLARENEQLEILIDSMTDGVIVADKKNYFSLLNRASERIIPLYSSSGPERVPVWDMIADKDIAGWVRAMLIREEANVEKEFSLSIPGSVKIVMVSIGHLVHKGHLRGTLIKICDVTEARSRENRLRRAENLAKMSTVAAGVAHEIKNPLGAISIHMQLIKRILSKNVCSYPPEVDENIRVVNEEIERLNKIVVDFLFAVRPMDLHLSLESIDELIDDLVQFMLPELAEGGISVLVNWPENLPKIMIDERYVKQALLNLLKNAQQAMPHGGKIIVQAELIDQEMHILIKDTGVGMSRETMDKIFEPFFTTKDFGSGIGLTIVYKIIREHGGEIMVESVEGSGTAFTLCFPLKKQGNMLLSAPISEGEFL